MVTAIIAAAGQGKRMNSNINKIFMNMAGKPVLVHSLLTFSSCPEVDNIIVVCALDDIQIVENILKSLSDIKPWQVVAGGSERQYSIQNALEKVPEQADIILVHDGARPLVSRECIQGVIAGARQTGAAIAAVPVKDTIKVVNNNVVAETPDRSILWSIQTPQGFKNDILKSAYLKAEAEGYLGTDDASLVERLGVNVNIATGSYANIKITTPEDLAIAEALIIDVDDKVNSEVNNMLRFGMGYDVHKLIENRKLILGGVEVPYEYGLEGHSDADVLLHAIKDALLGAAALGDIGRHFPDTDIKYKGASSIMLLGRVKEIICKHGYTVNNIDATIVAQKPKLAPYIQTMNENIAQTLGIKINQVNVKATTTEGLGFTGKKKGIAAYAVASILPNK